MRERSFKAYLCHVPERLAMRFARRSYVHEIALGIFLQPKQHREQLRAKVEAALGLIRKHSPKYYERIRAFIPKILIFGIHDYSAVYVADLNMCHISRTYALSEQTSPSMLAMTLVHEATHGYLHSLGFRYQAHRRARIERICINAGIHFARKAPDGEKLIARAQRQLDIPEEYWKGENFYNRDIEHLQAMGAPRWFVSILQKRRRRQCRKTKT